MGKTKTIEVSIHSLRTTYTEDDVWLKKYQEVVGTGVEYHPNYLCLKGDDSFLREWFQSLGLDWEERKSQIIELFEDIKDNGIKEPIKIYKDMKINTGHKRACIALFLGQELIRAEIVQDDYKL